MHAEEEANEENELKSRRVDRLVGRGGWKKRLKKKVYEEEERHVTIESALTFLVIKTICLI